MATTFKSNDSAIATMQNMLQERCIAEPQFAIRMASSDRTMEQAVAYLCREAQKMGVCMLDDATVMNILVHFFDGDTDVSDNTSFNCNIVVSKPELSEKDKAELKAQAMEQYKEEQLRELRKQQSAKSQPKHSAAPKARADINTDQPSLFDL